MISSAWSGATGGVIKRLQERERERERGCVCEREREGEGERERERRQRGTILDRVIED
jgi:hypothetical protein